MTQQRNTQDIVYSSQFKQKIHIAYFPLTWQGLLLLFICWALPLGPMDAGGVYLFFGFVIYRNMIATRDHEVEQLTAFRFVVSFLRWVEKNKEKKNA